MPKKPPRKPQPAPSQMLQPIKSNDALAVYGDRRRATLRMNAFIREYERQCGNISATCNITGVSRRTYYRWINGEAPIHRRFQKKIGRIIPGKRLVDAAQSVILHHLNNKELTAAIFTLKTQGKNDGWSERQDPAIDLLEKVAAAFMRFASERPDATIEDKARWVSVFAQKSRVEPRELAKRVGIDV